MPRKEEYMNAEIYNQTRRILFSTANDRTKGFSVAYEWMEQTYREQLGSKGYVGLLAELKFYEQFKSEFNLTVAGDMGEHADFSGLFESEITRFDVTTNLDYKNFEDYEPYLSDGPKYSVVLIDPNNFEVSDVVSLAFERCACGGYMVPFILLMDQNCNDKGESQWSNDQIHMKICNNCSEFKEIYRHTHHFLFSPSEYSAEIPDEMPVSEAKKVLKQYSLNTYKFFRREFCDELMGIAEYSYRITGRKGEGYWTFNFYFKNQVLANELPDDIECGLIL
jgi:hypothetical protein